MDCTPALATRDAWLGQCVADIGRPRFHARLLEGIHAVLGADHFSHLSYDPEGRIRHAAAASVCNQPLIDSTTDIYVKHLYRRDPNYPLVREGRSTTPQAPAHGGADLRLLGMSPTGIGDSEYRRVLFDEPGFTGKVSLLGLQGGHRCYLNFYFSRVPLDMGRASTLLGQYGSTLMGLACRHNELAFPEDGDEDTAWGTLSPRERTTAELLMDGCTAKEIGRQMALSPATVVTYKERVFTKLGVANLREFLALGRARPS